MTVSSTRCASIPPTHTRMAATRADRSAGNYTVFENGVYTACAPCRDNPKKPPLWQVKGARIIHDQTDKMLYFENAQLEFFGVPMAYLPYFSTPDPTVKRKTGFLMPAYTTVPDLLATAWKPRSTGQSRPDYDATFNPRFTTRQGVLFQGEFRQRLINGSLSDPRLRHRPAGSGRFRRTAGRPPNSAAASTPRASSRSTTNGSGAGTAFCCRTITSSRTTGLPNTRIRWARS